MATQRTERREKFSPAATSAIREALILKGKLEKDIERMLGTKKKGPRSPKMKLEEVVPLHGALEAEVGGWLNAYYARNGGVN